MNDAVAYGVDVQRQTLPAGTPYWRVVRIHHLLPAENAGNKHLYLDLLDESGSRVSGAQARVQWNGGEEIVTIDQPAGVPGGRVTLWKHQVYEVIALGEPGTNLPSDRVTGLHTTHADEPPGNTLFRHSFAIDFQRAQAGDDPNPVADKPLSHFVLLAPAEQAAGQVDWQLAVPYIQAFGLAAGTQPDTARRAQRVTIIGSPTGGVSLATEQELVASGSQVERIAGTPGDIQRVLAQRMASGEA